jgi:hypothetical protein
LRNNTITRSRADHLNSPHAMAPLKKGKKSKDANKSTVTLHNFFFSPGAGSSNKPQLSKSSKKATPSKATPTSAGVSKEVIVIDSDSDEEVEVVRSTSKKRRRSEGSSDVEHVQCTPIRRVNTIAVVPHALPSLTSETTLNFGKPSALLGSSSHSLGPVVPTLSFGPPSALLGGPGLTAPTFSGTPLAFGEPTLLLGPRVSSSINDSVTQMDAEMDLGGDDEWGMGDDEMAVDPDEDEESAQLDESIVIQIWSCPLCQKVMSELSETVGIPLIYPSPAYSEISNARITLMRAWMQAQGQGPDHQNLR